MEINSDYANPFEFDQRLVMSRLECPINTAAAPCLDVNDRIKNALLEQQLAESKKKIETLTAESKREHFVSGGCGCGGTDGMKPKRRSHFSDDDDDDSDKILGLGMKKFLIILVVIMAAYCVIQYYTHQNEMREMMAAMCAMLKNHPGPAHQPAPQPVVQQVAAQPVVAQPVAPSQ